MVPAEDHDKQFFMIKKFSLFFLGCVSMGASAQNDVDAMRYSRLGIGGTARFVSMGGAFGALGADASVSSYNPAGLAIYRKGDMNFSVGLLSNNNNASVYNGATSINRFNLKFDNFGFVGTVAPKNDPDSRHVFAFTINQVQNFNNAVRFNGYTNSSSIAKDMLLLAKKYQSPQPNIAANLDPTYEGMGFNTYLLDTAYGQFFSYVDIKRAVKQTRDIVTTGRVNDMNVSYAYSHKDKFYFGASLGFPQLNYTSNTKHFEYDDRDSMRIVVNQTDTFDTYIESPLDYTQGGFKQLSYEEYFKTTGTGFNLKLGGIVRLSDAVRIGAYYHTPTVYWLQDSYYSKMSVTFDRNPSLPYDITEPEDGGFFKYRIVTPARYSANLGLVIQKLMLIGIDYEYVNYAGARLYSDDLADFEGSNALIKSVYKGGHNIRAGAELNVKPFMIRLGYVMQGNAYGDVFSGDGVRNIVSGGVGYRSKSGFYLDFSLSRTMNNSDYYFFSVLDTKGSIRQTTVVSSITAGLKF